MRAEHLSVVAALLCALGLALGRSFPTERGEASAQHGDVPAKRGCVR